MRVPITTSKLPQKPKLADQYCLQYKDNGTQIMAISKGNNDQVNSTIEAKPNTNWQK